MFKLVSEVKKEMEKKEKEYAIKLEKAFPPNIIGDQYDGDPRSSIKLDGKKS